MDIKRDFRSVAALCSQQFWPRSSSRWHRRRLHVSIRVEGEGLACAFGRGVFCIAFGAFSFFCVLGGIGLFAHSDFFTGKRFEVSRGLWEGVCVSFDFRGAGGAGLSSGMDALSGAFHRAYKRRGGCGVGGFYGGLALGNALLGALADRMRRPLALHGWLEIAIGIYACLFPWHFEGTRWIYFWFAGKVGMGGAAALGLKFVLVWRCCLRPRC